MENSVAHVNALILDIVENVRLANTPGEGTVDELYRVLDAFAAVYKDNALIPKSVAWALFFLRDNLEGALKYASGEDARILAGMSSAVNRYIERIFLE
ncbi:hypothetical protein [Kosakonia sp.]|uniref:hypothetical protein n=1 Tax=Kosakonia sp. TaxID=1916651 RepID=UPI002897E7E9|nr:hypothetical protein [Kosakonia sp.]